MLVAVGLLALGAAILYAGAEAAVRGASTLARATGFPAFALGALLFGIDPEGLGAAIAAAARGETAIATGEIFGAVLFLFSAAFGAALLVSRRPVPSPSPIMVLVPAIPLVGAATTLADRVVDRPEGALLIAVYAAYVAVLLRERSAAFGHGAELESEAATGGRGRGGVLAAGGLVLLVAGAAVAVAGAQRLVEETDLLAGFVGAGVLGIVVSIDEVFLEVLPVRRGNPELATGNLFGTLAAFSSGVLGLAALVRPLEVDSAGATAFLAVAALYAVVATAFLARGRAGRGVGAFVLAGYGAWLLVSSAL
jgi:cation:H+ antiporter